MSLIHSPPFPIQASGFPEVGPDRFRELVERIARALQPEKIIESTAKRLLFSYRRDAEYAETI